ncbi:MAG: hypothetical protein LBB52_09655 [Desulfovibrio sp.]|jgi:hypothetical protein|nr:hypothetical protein [Desulfovibrio sp.]
MSLPLDGAMNSPYDNPAAGICPQILARNACGELRPQIFEKSGFACFSKTSESRIQANGMQLDGTSKRFKRKAP